MCALLVQTYNVTWSYCAMLCKHVNKHRFEIPFILNCAANVLAVLSLSEFHFACAAMGTGLRAEQITAVFNLIDCKYKRPSPLSLPLPPPSCVSSPRVAIKSCALLGSNSYPGPEPLCFGHPPFSLVFPSLFWWQAPCSNAKYVAATCRKGQHVWKHVGRT